MPPQKRYPTNYPGVYYIEGKAIGSNKAEKIYYIDYRKDGKRTQEKAGRQFQDDMTPARASMLRSKKIEGNVSSNRKKREDEEAQKNAEAGRWTIEKLYASYLETRPDGKSKKIDANRYEKYLNQQFAKFEPANITILDIQKLKNRLKKANLSLQTQKHVLNLLTWIVNYGVKNGLCPALTFKIKKPTVNNEVTEFLTDDELKRLLAALDASENIQVANMLRLVLTTGLRRGECYKLRWSDVDFQQGFITIKNPKGGKDQKIPMNDSAQSILEKHPRTDGSDYVFPGKDGEKRISIQKATRKIREEAGLPPSFRMMHGLRHHYATTLAASGEVDLYVLQRLMTHKDPRMTQRYAHILDDNPALSR